MDKHHGLGMKQLIIFYSEKVHIGVNYNECRKLFSQIHKGQFMCVSVFSIEIQTAGRIRMNLARRIVGIGHLF